MDEHTAGRLNNKNYLPVDSWTGRFNGLSQVCVIKLNVYYTVGIKSLTSSESYLTDASDSAHEHYAFVFFKRLLTEHGKQIYV